jgi:hypothetical protein
MASVDPGSIEYHQLCLENLCRICSKRAQTKTEKQSRPPKLCASYSIKILQVFVVDISNDDDQTHPTHLCNSCYRHIINWHRFPNSDKYEDIKLQAIDTNGLWTKHDNSSLLSACKVCILYMGQCKGGGRLKSGKARQINEFASMDTMPFEPQLIENAETNTTVTHIVLPVAQPMTKECGTVISLVQPHSEEYLPDTMPESGFKTPSCHMKASHSTPAHTPSIPVPMVSSGAQTTPKTTLNDTLNRSIDSPLNDQEEQLLTRLTKRKLAFTDDRSMLICKTGGQVRHFICIC